MDSERRRVEKSVDANNIKAAVSVFNVDMYGATGKRPLRRQQGKTVYFFVGLNHDVLGYRFNLN